MHHLDKNDPVIWVSMEKLQLFHAHPDDWIIFGNIRCRVSNTKQGIFPLWQ
jgi:hypothetical protein